jgi:glycine cleavage system aminomethyltransferase T
MDQRLDNKTQRLQRWFDERPSWDHASYGEFMHIGANQTIFRIALEDQEINGETKVLDTACAVGGNARWMASLFGCQVYGNDIDETTSPIEAGLGWITKLNKDFVDREYLLAQKEQGTDRVLRGFKMLERGIPRQGYTIENTEGDVIGQITSGTQSPTLGEGIAMGYIQKSKADIGNEIRIRIRKNTVAAQIVRPGFLPKS